MIDKILNEYNIPGEFKKEESIDRGNINKTCTLTFIDNNKEKKYLLQKININVFNNPIDLMNNIEKVTSYLNNIYKKTKDKYHKTLEIVLNKNNEPLTIINNGYYRIYKYIDNCISYDNSKEESIIFNAGKAFGNFQKNLNDFPINSLKETIKDFHNTPKRLETLKKDIAIDKEKRVSEVIDEIDYIIENEKILSRITMGLDTNKIPLRVIHNDTKINNVLLDKKTNDFVAVIDLDTVMPGSLLYDYGDGVRSSASTALEDEKDLSKVQLDYELFKAYTNGFISETHNIITPNEISLMADSILIITLELAIRFLDDYINGDVYFKINYKEHNLDRARNQIALAKDISDKLDRINDYIFKVYSENKKDEEI